jgi:hypothetical protein
VRMTIMGQKGKDKNIFSAEEESKEVSWNDLDLPSITRATTNNKYGPYNRLSKRKNTYLSQEFSSLPKINEHDKEEEKSLGVNLNDLFDVTESSSEESLV